MTDRVQQKAFLKGFVQVFLKRYSSWYSSLVFVLQ